MLLSYLLVAMAACFAALALGAHASGIAQEPEWRWSSFAWPSDAAEWALIGAVDLSGSRCA